MLMGHPSIDYNGSYAAIVEEARTGCQGCRILKQAIEFTRKDEQKSEDVTVKFYPNPDKFLNLVVNGGPETIEVYRLIKGEKPLNTR